MMDRKDMLVRILGIALSAVVATSAEDLPTATSLYAEMGMGWNLGNTMEVPGDPTAWGNPLPTRTLIDSVKAAGFSTIRIPCAWYSHTEADSLTIKPEWMAQVRQLVDDCIRDSLFVILNVHWDNGWLESHVDTTNSVFRQVNRRQGAYWRQIATAFRDCDRHLLLASANEPAMQDAWGTAFGPDRMAVLNAYHQTFIDSVRATGGNNATRTLVIQGPRTDIELTESVMRTLPVDRVPARLMTEVHFYPYQFSLMTEDADWGKVFWYWGQTNLSTGIDADRNTTWCGEAYVDSMFRKMQGQFVDKGIPVILGEFGAIKRTTLTGDTLVRHLRSLRSFYSFVSASSRLHGIVPIAWDPGGDMKMIDRTGRIADLGLLNAMRAGVGLVKLDGDTSLVKLATRSSSMKVLYSAKDSLFGGVEFPLLRTDFSKYDSILVRAYLNGEANYQVGGVSKYGWVSLSLVTMSDNWKWREAAFGSLPMNRWNTYGFGIGTDTAVKTSMVPADAAKIDYFGLQAYSTGYRGTIYLDWIALRVRGGGWDTAYTFDLEAPGKHTGNVDAIGLIPTDEVEGDLEWQTATTSKYVTATEGAVRPGRRWRRDGSRFEGRSGGRIRLLDTRGQLVRTGVGFVDLANLPRGLYFADTESGSSPIVWAP